MDWAMGTEVSVAMATAIEASMVWAMATALEVAASINWAMAMSLEALALETTNMVTTIPHLLGGMASPASTEG